MTTPAICPILLSMISIPLQQLLHSFSQAHRWNIAIYFINKILSLIILFFLYANLSSTTFAAWINITSILYIFLLWADFGFRKSIPRFAPLFIRGNLQQFVQFLISIQLFMIACTLPFVLYGIYRISIFASLNITILLITSAIAYISEGILFLLRLIYQSYFLHKPITLLTSVINLIETCVTIVIIYYAYQTLILLPLLLCIKSITSMSTCCAYVMLIALPHNNEYNSLIQDKKIKKEFIQHSFIMWLYNSLKSLSERNALLPFITYMLGPVYAGMYKVANESALLFYRIVLKTIGTTDTSLLSFIEEHHDQQKLMTKAFEKLSTKVAALCIPLVGVVIGIYVSGETIINNQYVFHLFLIMTITYLIELLLLPCERLMEVKKQYWYLMFAYVPYIITLILLYSTSLISLIGLKNSIIIIQSVRLVSIGLISFYVREYMWRQFKLSTLFYQVIKLSIVAIIIACGSYIIKCYVYIPEWFVINFKKV